MTTKTNRTRTTTPPPPQAIAHGITLRKDDWVTLTDPRRGEAYRAGHIDQITPHGLRLAYGSRTLPSYFRHGAYSNGAPARPSEVGEVWRKRDRVTRTEFTYDGRTIPVTTLDYEWVQLHPPQEEH